MAPTQFTPSRQSSAVAPTGDKQCYYCASRVQQQYRVLDVHTPVHIRLANPPNHIYPNYRIVAAESLLHIPVDDALFIQNNIFRAKENLRFARPVVRGERFRYYCVVGRHYY